MGEFPSGYNQQESEEERAAAEAKAEFARTRQMIKNNLYATYEGALNVPSSNDFNAEVDRLHQEWIANGNKPYSGDKGESTPVDESVEQV